jgi:predicted nucleic acid-binding protein
MEAPNSEQHTLILDATVLSNFLKAGYLNLLQSLSSVVCLSPAVAEEIAEGMRREKIPAAALDWLPVVVLSAEEQSLAERLRTRLGAGEADSLAIASMRGWTLATDDRDARRIAAQFQVAVTGTIGILARLVEEDILDIESAEEILHRMIVQGYYSPISSLREVLTDPIES